VSELAERFKRGDVRALARMISLVEGNDATAAPLLAELRAHAGPQPRRVGLTGSPGVGKSSLLGEMIRTALTMGHSVGVLAIDPSSPFTGGALLGDRLRMDQHLLDPRVFIRSAGSRGRLGGLSPAAVEATWLLGAFGFDEVLVETVGTGQSEVDLSALVDTTVVVLNPNSGDLIQLEKAGLNEIADIFVVNKADLPGAKQLMRDLHLMLGMGNRRPWLPKVLATVASPPDGSVANLWAAIAAHRAYLTDDPAGQADDARKTMETAADLVASRARAWALEACASGLVVDVSAARLPHTVADQLFRLAAERSPSCHPI
jgi:LAO/AO transport system kinase